MDARILYLSYFLLTFSNGNVFGSSIQFTSSPNEIHANLTSTLTLTCDLNDTMTSSSNLVGRRDVTQTSDNVAFLTSLVIVKNGNEHLATVTEHTAATALVGGSGTIIEVKGQISGSSGFLQISWDYPTDDQVAEYVCEANAVTSLGHGVQFSRSLEVKVTQPDVSDLVNYIHSLQVKSQAQEEANLLQLKQQKQTNLELKADIQDLKTAVTQARHVESGVIACGPQSSWPGKITALHHPNGADQDDYISKIHSFATVYDKAPVVHLSVEYIWANLPSDFVYHSVELVQVDERKFTMRCRSNSDRIIAMTVTWISVPQQA